MARTCNNCTPERLTNFEWTKEELALLVELRDKGLSMSEIEDAFRSQGFQRTRGAMHTKLSSMGLKK